MKTTPSRGKTIIVSLMFAGGLAVGAVKFGQLAFGQHDAAPESIALSAAAAQPENKWATLRGQIDLGSAWHVSHPLGNDQVAFRLRGAGNGIVVLTNTKRHPLLADPALWQPGFIERVAQASGHAPADVSLKPETASFVTDEQTFTGVITEPGSGMNTEGHVELDDDRFKVTGVLGSYCGSVGGCPREIKVLLVGAAPRGRFAMLAVTVTLGLLALLFIGVAFRPARANA